MKVEARISTTDRKISETMDIGDFLIEQDRGVLLDWLESDFDTVFREEVLGEWTDLMPEEPADRLLEHIWQEEDRGREVDVEIEIDPSACVDFIKARLPRIWHDHLWFAQRLAAPTR